MNPLIASLSMLKEDIRKHANEKAGTGMLTGQTITEEEIISLPAYKLMTIEERQVVRSILDSMKKESSKSANQTIPMTVNGSQTSNPINEEAASQGMNRGKVLLKQIDGVVPFPKKAEQDKVIDYKDAA